MDQGVFQSFCEIAYKRAGIFLKQGKEPLVAARVAKRLRALGVDNERSYLRMLQDDASGTELVHFIDAITTNFTSFLREPEHFDLLADELANSLSDGQRRFRYWSAACSSGEEPYSMAISILERIGEIRPGLDIKILATDISTRMLEHARRGVYEEKNVEQLSKHQLTRFFTKIRSSDNKTLYSVAPALRELVVYKRLNLARGLFPMRGPFDVIFCRNVMIYFDNDVRQRLVSAMERLLCPGGLLVIGHTETLTSMQTQLRAVKPSVYRRPL